MRKLKSISVALMLSSLLACAREVPQKVKDAFAKKFPMAKSVKWDKESDTEWEAEFKMRGKEYSANFMEDGTWTETEHEIGLKELPVAVKNGLKATFPDYKIKESEISETQQGTVYEFELKKGTDEREVAIDKSGKIVKTEMKEDSEDKD